MITNQCKMKIYPVISILNNNRPMIVTKIITSNEDKTVSKMKMKAVIMTRLRYQSCKQGLASRLTSKYLC